MRNMALFGMSAFSIFFICVPKFYRNKLHDVSQINGDNLTFEQAMSPKCGLGLGL